MTTTLSTDLDRLTAMVSRLPVFEELRRGAIRREELERRLDVSRATCYRYTDWLSDAGLVEESSQGITLTSTGEAITEEATRFERTVLSTLGQSETDHDLLSDVVSHAPGLDALLDGPRDRRALEEHLEVSRTTSYRLTRSLEDLGLIEKSGGRYALTAAGEAVVDAVATFETAVRTALRLGPVLDAVGVATPAFDLDEFADATVTTSERGDAHSPVNRFIMLVEETDTLRGVDLNSVVPVYIREIRQRIVEGMETEDIMKPAVAANFLAELPDDCIEACRSPYVTLYLHDDPPYGLVILDDRVGIAVRDGESRTLRAFVDTDSPEVRTWAESVFESYKAEAVRLEKFSPWGLRRAVEKGSLDVAETVDG